MRRDNVSVLSPLSDFGMVQHGSLLQGPASWVGKYYKYRVKVYSPWSQRIETLEPTDPNSRSLAADGARTQVCPGEAPCFGCFG